MGDTFKPGPGRDRVFGGQGKCSDRLTYAQIGRPVRVNLAKRRASGPAIGDDKPDGGDGNDRGDGGRGDDSCVSVEEPSNCEEG